MTEFIVDFKQMNSNQISNFQIPFDENITSMKIYNYSASPSVLDFLPETIETFFIQLGHTEKQPDFKLLPISVKHLILSSRIRILDIYIPPSILKITIYKRYNSHYDFSYFLKKILNTNVSELDIQVSITIDYLDDLIDLINNNKTLKKISIDTLYIKEHNLELLKEKFQITILLYNLDYYKVIINKNEN
jgi:hypothetical protein